jgi:HK97 family phage prohead protease
MAIKKRHIISIEENEETITIVYEKDIDAFPENDIETEEDVDAEMEEIEEEEVIRAPGDMDMEETPEEEIEEEIDEEEEEEIEEDEVRSKTKIDVWDKKHTSETRYFNMESRLATKEGKDVVIGHAAVFNSLSEDLGGFREKIQPGAFDDVLKNDVRAYFNHDPNYLLGRTSAGTLRLSVDEQGLRYELDVPNTTAGRDLKENMRLGNITQSSFAFTIGKDGDAWERAENGADIRTIKKVKRLYDVSPVSLPAYPSANDLALAVRSNFMDKENTRKEQETEYEKNSLLNLKINLIKRKK